MALVMAPLWCHTGSREPRHVRHEPAGPAGRGGRFGWPGEPGRRRAARPRARGGRAAHAARGALRGGRRDHEGAGAGGGGDPPARQRPRLRRDAAGLRGRRRRHVRASAASPTVVPAGDDEGGTSRLNLRLPDGLKAKIDEAARREGLSLNAWLVRAAAAAVEGTQAPTSRRSPARQPDVHRMGPVTTTTSRSTTRIRSAHADVRDQPAHRRVDRAEPGRGARHRQRPHRHRGVREPERSGPAGGRRGGGQDRRRPGQRDPLHQAAEAGRHRRTRHRMEAARLGRRDRGAPRRGPRCAPTPASPTSAATAVSTTST